MDHQKMSNDHLYRQGVGIVLINQDKKIFAGKRIDNHSNAWQMPQGGIEAGEDEDKAMLRELEEETGIKTNPLNVKILSKSKKYFYYNLPYKLQKKFWGGKFLGQKQRWYLVEFLGNEDAINVKTNCAEFSDWKWASSEDITQYVVGFKRSLYIEILNEFKEFLQN